MGYCFGEVSHALEGGTTGPGAYILVSKLLGARFDRVDTGVRYTKLHNFGVSNGTSLNDFSREFRW